MESEWHSQCAAECVNVKGLSQCQRAQRVGPLRQQCVFARCSESFGDGAALRCA